MSTDDSRRRAAGRKDRLAECGAGVRLKASGEVLKFAGWLTQYGKGDDGFDGSGNAQLAGEDETTPVERDTLPPPANGFEQLGWQVRLERWSDGFVEAILRVWHRRGDYKHRQRNRSQDRRANSQ